MGAWKRYARPPVGSESMARLKKPGTHPLPPPDLAFRELLLVQSKGPWFRFHGLSRDPLYFGKTGENRFDAPQGEYGVLYASLDPHGAFVETFGRGKNLPFITQEELQGRLLAKITASKRLTLVDLTGPGLRRIGADERLAAGEHEIAQLWSLALWLHPARPHGLMYRARHDPSKISVAIYSHRSGGRKGNPKKDTAGLLKVESLGNLMEPEHASLLQEILDAYGIGLL